MARSRSTCASLALRTRESGRTSHRSTPSGARTTSDSGACGLVEVTLTMRSMLGSFHPCVPALRGLRLGRMPGEECQDGFDPLDPGQAPALDLAQLGLGRRHN